ncbi:MAG: hypothetical protein QW572_05345 [Candidatus Nitrosocaldus sp.]
MSEISEQGNAVIVRCKRCNCWLASTNPRFIDEHIAYCSESTSEEKNVRKAEGIKIRQQRGYYLVMREPRIEHNQIVRCIAEIDGIRTKVVVSHIRRGKFVVLSTSVYEYRHLAGKVIDASDICAIIL